MKVKGITKRWIQNSLSLIIVILFVIILCFVFISKSYFYGTIQQTVKSYSDELSDFFYEKPSVSTRDFIIESKSYIESFPDKEYIHITIFDNEDNIILTSAGAEPDNQEEMPDYQDAKQSYSNYGSFIGKIFFNKHYMYATKFIYDSKGEHIGAARYMVSLSEVDHKIFTMVSLLFIIEMIVLLFIVLSSSYFIKSIVKPVRKISTTARQIAQGDFAAKIDKQYDDEIGELCDTINYMAFELDASEKIKNDFISSVSHELRTPLTAIKGWAETMAMSKSTDYKTIEKGLRIIIDESERLSGIVEELLDFSRMQNGRMTFMMDKIDILAELDEAIYIFRDRALSEKKELIYSAPEIVSPVFGDKNRLRQVFINIIDNALKYTAEEGSVKVDVLEESDNLKIVVTDNGCGINQNDLPKIKNKFYKANQTQRGSGIGLAIADEIIKEHSGSIDIVSQEGIGTIVTILIPIIKINDKDESNSEDKINNEA